MNDPHNLQRFLDAQESVFEEAQSELRAGGKEGHWMWFIFPQLKGLGSSPMAATFGIASKDEAEAYLQHPVLGPRLTECTRLVNEVKGKSIQEIFGQIDSMKFRSSMTLFAEAATTNEIFREALENYFAGQPDPLTVGRL
jgi:uncharacterized protein (DUF1810 family)